MTARPPSDRTKLSRCIGLAALLAALASPHASAVAAAPDNAQVDVADADKAALVPPELSWRARVTAITPSEPTDLTWRHGGEGLGGRPTTGMLGEKLAVGEWSKEIPVAALVPQGQFPKILFLTITAGRGGKLERRESGPHSGERRMVGASKDVNIEFEFRYRGKTIKQFSEAGPNGGTVGIVVPAGRLSDGKTPEDAEFLAGLGGLLSYTRRRAESLEALPWANQPLPVRYPIQTDLGGYGEGIYYGIRTTDRAVIEADVRTLRQLGVNGLRNAPGFLLEMIAQGEGYAKHLHRLRDTSAMGFPVAPTSRNKAESDPEAGCPFAPGVAARTKAAVDQLLHDLPNEPADEVWALTVDEIGSVFDGTPEGKQHAAVCPRCAEGFRQYVKQLGLKPADFGQKNWEDVKPLDIFAKDFKLDANVDRATGLRAYHTSMFVNDATARLFTPLRDALAKLNDEKRAALAAGSSDTAAKRPYIYSYALRGNTFLMGGHSLDFFEFYRHADNGFVYEMSNRDPRVWHWDSHLCDVGRLVSAQRGLQFGVYVKPHRGAPLQRALTALSRNARMLYWYTYGPDWAKGDTFAAEPEALKTASKAARLIAASEEVLFGSEWMVPAQVAIVNPRSSEQWMRRLGSPPDRVAAWENAKWIYTALAHAHIPVDAIDERILDESSPAELARYKVLYLNGPNLTAAAAANVARWVEAGGNLCTSAGGLQFDEANQPLLALDKVLGLERRALPEMWKRVELYGATSLESYDDPARAIAKVPSEAQVTGQSSLSGSFSPVVGREVLHAAEHTEMLAKFADGGVAATRHPHGKGAAWVVGLYPGLEYSAPLRKDGFDMTTDFDAVRRSFVTAACHGLVAPVVDCNHPTVEGVLLRNTASGRRAVTLTNWAYRSVLPPNSKKGAKAVPTLVPVENLKITIRGAGNVQRAKAATSGQPLDVTRAGDTISITIPHLEEGEVLLLD